MPRPPMLGLCCALALAAASPAIAADAPAPPSTPAVQAPAKTEGAAPADDHDQVVKSFREEVKGDRRPEEEDFNARSVFWMFAAMAFVIGAIYITLNFGLRRLMGVRAVGSAQLVSVMERTVLDQKKSLLVVRAAGEYLLLGASDEGVNLICKLDSQQVERLERESRVQAAPGLSPFLQKLLARKGGPPPPSA